MERSDPKWCVGEERRTSKSSIDQEHRYIVRMVAERWRRQGLSITAVCRCEPTEPCFDHTVYIADLRSQAAELLEHGDAYESTKLSTEATELYLRLTK